MTIYKISRYCEGDIDDDGYDTPGYWEAVAATHKPMQLRPHIRRLRESGYDDDVSILVEAHQTATTT